MESPVPYRQLSDNSPPPSPPLRASVCSVVVHHAADVDASARAAAAAGAIEAATEETSRDSCVITPPPVNPPTPHTETEIPMPTPTEEVTASADPELLQALGDFEVETAEWGPEIIEDLAKRWEPLLKDGLKKETRENLVKKYLIPKNCPLLKPPVLNPEIASMLNDSARNRDKRILKKQEQMGCVLAILGKVMSCLLTKSIETTEVLRNLSDAAQILADSHYSETETRRSLVTPMVDKTFIDPFKDRKRDSHLFGDKLGDFVKTSRGIQKTGKLIQSSGTPANNLNWKGPSSSRYQQQRNSRAQVSRGGAAGQRAAYPYRRRGPHPAAQAHPTARRAPQPPPSPPPPSTTRYKQTATSHSKQKR